MKKYKRLLIYIGLYLTTYHHQMKGQVSAYPSQALHPMAITLSATEQKASLSGPIMLTYTIKNTGSVEESFETMAGRSEYDLVRVTLTYNGKRVPETPFGRRLRGEFHEGDPRVPDVGSTQFIHIGPGKSLTVKIDLTKLYNITQPGSYLCSVHLSPDSFNKQSEETKPIVLDINP